MPERLRTALRASLVSTAGAAIACYGLSSFISPGIGVLLAFFPPVWTSFTTAHTFKAVRDNIVSSSLGTTAAIIFMLAVPPDLYGGWLHGGLLIVPMLLIACAHGFPWVSDYTGSLHLVFLPFILCQMPGVPVYAFILIVVLGGTLAMLAAMCPWPLGAMHAREAYTAKIGECLVGFNRYYDQMYNEKLRRTVTLADIETECYRLTVDVRTAADLVRLEPWSELEPDWNKVMVLLDSALLRLTGMHESISGDDWEGYSRKFIDVYWQSNLPSFEFLKSDTMILANDARSALAEAPARQCVEAMYKLKKMDVSHHAPVSGTALLGAESLARISMGGLDGETLKAKSEGYTGAHVVHIDECSTNATGPNLLATGPSALATMVENGDGRQPGRMRSDTTGSYTGVNINPESDLGVAYTYCAERNLNNNSWVQTEAMDELACAELIKRMTESSRARLSSGHGWSDNREEIGRYNMFASQAIDYYAHLQALERKVKKLGLRRSPMDVLRVLWYHLSRIAIAAWGVLKSPVQEGLKPLCQSYSFEPWRFWVRMCLLVWAEWLGMIAWRQTIQQDNRWLWVMFTTIIVVKPVMVVSINLGLQRMLGTLVMFALGWATAVMVRSNIFAYLYANLLIVLLAKLAEYWLGSNGYLAVVAQLTWQVMVFGTVNNSDVTFMYSFSRFITIAAGTLIGLIGSLVIFPEFVTPRLVLSLKRLYTLLLENFVSVLSSEALHGNIDNDALDARRTAISKELAGMHELVRLAQIESKYAIHWSKAVRTLPWKALARKTWYMRRALAGMVSTARSGVFSDADVHAAVIEPIQPDVDAVVRDAVAYFDRIEGNLDERFYDRHFDLRPSIAEDSLEHHSLDALMDSSWTHYTKMRKLLLEGKLSVWYTMSFHRLLFSIRDFCVVVCELEAELRRKHKGNETNPHEKVPKRHQ